jgi:hypothetical protein
MQRLRARLALLAGQLRERLGGTVPEPEGGEEVRGTLTCSAVCRC